MDGEVLVPDLSKRRAKQDSPVVGVRPLRHSVDEESTPPPARQEVKAPVKPKWTREQAAHVARLRAEWMVSRDVLADAYEKYELAYNAERAAYCAVVESTLNINREASRPRGKKARKK